MYTLCFILFDLIPGKKKDNKLTRYICSHLFRKLCFCFSEPALVLSQPHRIFLDNTGLIITINEFVTILVCQIGVQRRLQSHGHSDSFDGKSR